MRSVIAGLTAVLLASTAHAQYVAPQYQQPQYAPPQYAQAQHARSQYVQPQYGPPPQQGQPQAYARAAAAPPPMVVAAQPQRMQADLGGGFIEFLFGGSSQQQGRPAPQTQYYNDPGYGRPQIYANADPAGDPSLEQPGPPIDPRYLKQEVAYSGTEAPGTVVIDTPNKFLYLVQPGGRALRYGIGVGRPGFTWSGTHKVSAKKEWPDWTPPEEMLQRQPYLPHFMPGGPNNPLGARALYLGSTLYRIHGSNEPWTIGQNVSSGCIRMRNTDVMDLYDRVKVGATVVVM